MLELVISLLFILSVYNLKIDRLSKRVLLIYLIVWIIGILISRSGFYDLKIISDKTTILLFLHLLTFVLGFLIVKIRKVNNEMMGNLLIQVTNLLRSNWFRGFFFATFAYVIYLFVAFYQRILYYNSLKEVRTEYFMNSLFDDTFLYINNYYLIPVQAILLATFSFMLFYKKNAMWVLIGIYIVIFGLFSGSRGEFLNIILAIIFVAICIRPKNLNKKYSKSSYVILSITIILAYLVISWLTFAREGNIKFNLENIVESTTETNKHVVLYLGGPIIAFDIAINNEIQDKFGGFQEGALTFASVEEGYFYFRVLHNKVFGSGLYRRPIETIGTYLHGNTIDIGYEWWNSLYTSCLYYYLDFGIIGVILLPFFLGILLRYLIKLFQKYANLPLYIVTSMIFIILVNTIQRMFFYRFSQLCLVIILVFIGWHQFKKLQRKKNVTHI